MTGKNLRNIFGNFAEGKVDLGFVKNQLGNQIAGVSVIL